MDNTKTVQTVVPDNIATPFSENFNNLPETWSLMNADEETTWTVVQTGAVNNSANKAIYMKFFQSEESVEELDVITTPGH